MSLFEPMVPLICAGLSVTTCALARVLLLAVVSFTVPPGGAAVTVIDRVSLSEVLPSETVSVTLKVPAAA